MRFSNPRRRSKFLKPKSASNTAVVAPLLASAIPRFAVKVVLPTPPLPEQIKIVRVFFTILEIFQIIKPLAES